MAWVDSDRDGRHDVTGETYDEYLAYQEQLGGPSQDGPQAPVYNNQAEADAARAADRDARGGNTPARDYASQTGNVGAGDPNDRTDATLGVEGLSDFDESSRGTFLWGDITGANARGAEYDRARQEAEKQGWIDQAEYYAPSADDLWVQYEEEGNVAGPERSEAANVFADQGLIDQQQSALDAFGDIVNSNGITGADRARLAQGEQEMGRAMRSQRDADMSQLQARGMGGSGAAIQSMLGAQQGGADMLAGREGQMQIEGQRRRDAAIGAMGDMAGGMRDQGFNEGAYRGEAADSFNRYQTDYQRGREGRNTAYRNRTRESRAESRQGSFNNQKDLAAMRTNQYSPTRDPSEVADASNEKTGGFLSGLLNLI